MGDFFAEPIKPFLEVSSGAITESQPASPAGRSIGAILIDRGRLSTHGAERILALQKEKGIRFGDAAIMLGLLTDDDIRQALSDQFHYAYLPFGDVTLDRTLVAAYQPFSLAVEDLRALRTQLLLRWFDASVDRRTLAIVSPGSREGRSHIVANLAVVFSQLGERTLVIDSDLRMPCQHRLFNVSNQLGLSDMLSDRCGLDAVVKTSSLRGLSVLPAGVTPPNPQELLGRAAFSSLLQTLSQDFDVIILDTPASTQFADAYTVATRAKAALLVTRQHFSSLNSVKELICNLQEYGITMVGSVLNRA